MVQKAAIGLTGMRFDPDCSVRSFEILNGAFVRPSRLTCAERSQISALAGFGIPRSGIEAVFTRFQFSNHTGRESTFVSSACSAGRRIAPYRAV